MKSTANCSGTPYRLYRTAGGVSCVCASGSSTGAGVKTYLMERLKERHRERRSPYVRELAALEQRIQHDWAA